METLQAIFTRRSIRHFTRQAVPPEQVETLLKAAMYAPSSGNSQPWQFIVIDDAAVLNEIPKFHEFARMLHEAPLAIVVCGDETLQKYPGRWPQDCSAATLNILLAAHDLGLGGVWLGIYPHENREKSLGMLLGLPDHVHPLSIVALGYPDEVKNQPDRYKPERVHANRW